MTQVTLNKAKKWLSDKNNQLLMAEWAARLIGWKLGIGGLLTIPFKIYRKYKNDENNDLISIKKHIILIEMLF